MTSRSISLRISKGLTKDVAGLTLSERAVVLEFLKRLQDNPYEETLIGNSEAHEDIFASTVGRRYLYWTIGTDREGADATDMGATIVTVLGLEKTLRRRSRSRSQKDADVQIQPLLKHLAGNHG
jgi:hypothetical protein